MRRPASIVGLTLLLLRRRSGLARAVVAVGAAVATLGVGAALHVRHRPAPAAIHFAGGTCARSGATCFTDAQCGAADRCASPPGIDAALGGVRALGTTLLVTPVLVADGDGFAAAWSAVDDETADVWFARLDGRGRKRGAPVRITRGGGVRLRPRLARSSQGFGLGWIVVREDGLASEFVRLDANGRPQGAPAPVGSGEVVLLSDVAVADDLYGVAYATLTPDRFFTLQLLRMGLDGRPAGEPAVVAQDQIVLGTMGLAPTSRAWVYAWNHSEPRTERAETKAALVYPDGRSGTLPRLDAHAGLNGSTAAANGPGASSVVWEDGLVDSGDGTPRNGLVFGGFAEGGAPIAPRLLGDRTALSIQPSLAAWGNAFAVASTRIADEAPSARLLRVRPDGTAMGAPITLEGRASVGAFPSVVAAGDGIAVSWMQIGATGSTLRFACYGADGKRVGGDVSFP